MSMNERIVECVPNISEGRDAAKIERIVAAAAAVEGVEVLDVDPGRDTNRTVITFVGPPKAVSEAAFQLIAKAAELIDMRGHSGAHARHGATDVCPFVPVSGVTMEDCIQLARDLGRRVGEELKIPVYLYDQAALLPERRSLAKVRAGEYEALPRKMKDPAWAPDFGPAEFLPKTGVVTIGAREFLIAYNIDLNTTRKEYADDIAFELREKGRALRRDMKTPYTSSGRLVKYAPSRQEFPCGYCEKVATSLEELATHSREAHQLDLSAEFEFFGRDPDHLEGVNVMRRGMFKECRGVGWYIPEYGLAQISLNLTNYKITPAHAVLEAARDLARDRGLQVTGSELVGLIPFAAIKESAEYYLERQGASRGIPTPDLLRTAAQSMGLEDVAAFDAEKSVLGLPKREGPLVQMNAVELADEVSRATPAPGGGSIAALAGSLGAALAAMVGNLTFFKKGMEDHREAMERLAVKGQRIKDDLLRAVDADTDAFNDVIAAMRLPKSTEEERTKRTQAIQDGYKSATRVPLRTAELCLEAMQLCEEAAESGLPASVTDAGVGALMARSGALGAVYNVLVNLGSIEDSDFVADMRAKVTALKERAEELERKIRDIVERRI